MNRFNKYLNKKAKQMLSSEENQNEFHYNFKQCRKYWKYALTHYKHYRVMLNDMGIVKSK